MEKIVNLKITNLFSLVFVIATVWFLGNAVFTPQKAMALTEGDLIKSPSSSAVYYLGADNKKYVFPDEKVYYSWYEDFSLVHTVSLETIQTYQTVNNVKMRAGTKLIQFVAINADGSMNVDDPKVYALEPNGVRRWISSAEVAISLYGEDWETKIYGCPNTLIDNYSDGDELSTAIYPTGSVVEDNTEIIYYFNEGGNIQELTDDGVEDNLIQSEYILTADECLSCSYSTGEMINSAVSNLISVTADTPANLPDNVYVVSTDGDDNNPGTIESPFKTISRAAEVATAGDIVYIRAGVYEETVRPENSGQEDKMIIFTNYPDEAVELRGTEGYGFYLEEVGYIKIDGLTITRGLGGGVQTIYPEYKAENVVHGAAIKLEAAHYIMITDNNFYDNDIGVFIAPYATDDNPSTYNQIIDNQIHHSGEAGIRNKRSDYTTIDSNTIYSNGFKDNPVYSEPSAGIAYYCTTGTTITNNTIYGNSTDAIQNYAGTNAETCNAQSTLIENNVLVQTLPSPFEDRVTYGEYIVIQIADSEITDASHIYRNNAFYNGQTGSIMVGWGLDNMSNTATLMTVDEFNAAASSLNPNSGGNIELLEDPI